ncbi:MAG TPA: GntR family transcriptional regulator [Caulobacteraceae bacterium]|nr:GntR family transcriptional regulator [Caulobacteraceae bacterium]
MLKENAPRPRPVNITAGDKAYEIIRALILEGRFAPGDWLREEELTSVCGVSRTPIREAIRRLVAEGLIVKNPRFGAQVASIAPAELEEIYTLRAMVESHAAARAATRIGDEQIARLMELASVMERAAIAGDEAIRTRYTHANAEFHRIILDAADSPRLTKMAALLVELPLTLRTLAKYSLEDRQRSLRHHRELIAAFQARSPQWASAAMQSHVHAALHALLRPAARGAETAA